MYLKILYLFFLTFIYCIIDDCVLPLLIFYNIQKNNKLIPFFDILTVPSFPIEYQNFQFSNFPTFISDEFKIIDIYSLIFTLFFLTTYILSNRGFYTINITTITISFIYIKYLLSTIIMYKNISVLFVKLRRGIVWLFTCPLILYSYSDANNITFIFIGGQYHIISNIIYILLIYLNEKNMKNLYCFMVSVMLLFEIIFISRLHTLKHYKYTRFILYIWYLYSFIYLIEFSDFLIPQHLFIFYTLSDMIAKVTTILIISDYETQIETVKEKIDIQGLQLLSSLKGEILKITKTNISENCKMVATYINCNIDCLIPYNKTNIKLELLKKILPFNLDESYISKMPVTTHYTNISIFFSDIVNYTVLAKTYNEQIIFNLLNDIYTLFDTIVDKYHHLQKIETIGDAYMIVGDLYNLKTDKHVMPEIIKEIILVGIEFIQNIKNIKTPNGSPLSIRIGIDIGNVVVGILGNGIPRLCVVGNSVNVAARLQTCAEPDTIQISENIYNFIKNENEFKNLKKNEEVYLKNIGNVTTYTIIVPPIAS